MADPLSIAAGVGGLLALVGHVANRTRKFYLGVKDATVKAEEFITELDILQSHLNRLEVLLEEHRDDENFAFGSDSVLQTSITACRTKLQRLSVKLPEVKRSRLQRLKWPFSEQDHRETIQELRTFSQWIQLGLTVDGSSLLAKTSEDVLKVFAQQLLHFRILEEQSAHIKTKVDTSNLILTDDKEDKYRGRVLDWLSSYEPQAKHDSIRQPRVAGTGSWLLSHRLYKAWRDGTASSNVLWCHGIPGAGKSVLASLVIDEVQQLDVDDNTCSAYFYFDYREEKEQRPEVVIASLLKQMLQYKSSLPSYVYAAYERRGKSQLKTRELLEELFLDVCMDSSRVHIVFDALDECDRVLHRKQILQIIGLLEKIKHVQVFVTSRPYPDDLQEALSRAPSIEIEAHDADLRTFLAHKLDSTWASKVFDAHLREKVITAVLENAQGMFLLPELQIRTILEQPTVGDVKETLKLLPKDLPSTLAKTITRIRAQTGYYQKLGMDVLMWVSQAKSSLTARALRDVLAVPRSDDNMLDADFRPVHEYLVESCFGLILIDEDDAIRCSHYSIQEYLSSNKHDLFPDADIVMFKHCIKYQSFAAFRSGPVWNSPVDLTLRAYQNPFCRYASTCWGIHARALDDSESLDRMLTFVQDREAVASAMQLRHDEEKEPIDYSRRWADPDLAYSCTPLHVAAEFKLVRLMERLLALETYEIDAFQLFKRTALHVAAARNHADMVRLLIAHGADPYKETWDGNTLHVAAIADADKVPPVLVAHGMDIDHQEPRFLFTPLLRAALANRAVAGRVLLDLGAAVYSCAKTGANALHVAASNGALEFVSMLIARGTDLERRDGRGRTALHVAIIGDQRAHKTLSLLLDGGADIDARADGSESPLHVAVAWSRLKAVALLLNRGADTEARDDGRNTPLLRALAAKMTRPAAALLARGADPSAVRSDGRSARDLAETAIARLEAVVARYNRQKRDDDDDDSDARQWQNDPDMSNDEQSGGELSEDEKSISVARKRPLSVLELRIGQLERMREILLLLPPRGKTETR